jgi:hypothetical protein
MEHPVYPSHECKQGVHSFNSSTASIAEGHVSSEISSQGCHMTLGGQKAKEKVSNQPTSPPVHGLLYHVLEQVHIRELCTSQSSGERRGKRERELEIGRVGSPVLLSSALFGLKGPNTASTFCGAWSIRDVLFIYASRQNVKLYLHVTSGMLVLRWCGFVLPSDFDTPVLAYCS